MKNWRLAAAMTQVLARPSSAAGKFQQTQPAGGKHGRITVCCRVRPLLHSELAQNVAVASWVLTEQSITLKHTDRQGSRSTYHEVVDGAGGGSKTRSEVRALEHLRREDFETAMDHVFDGQCTTQHVYDTAFRNIVAGAAEGLNGAILAYGQTSSGKTFSISGSTARSIDDNGVIVTEKGIIHFALEDLFDMLQSKASAASSGVAAPEFLVRMSYCELYMERVNDLLRKISPQSQNLQVKEDPETKMFFVDGLKEKIVGSSDEVVNHLAQAEKRRRVAYTRFNEVSSRSHTLLTLLVECSTPLESAEGAPQVAEADAPRMTRIGRLVIVDLAGNERVESGTEYMAESSSINKSLFFLGKVIEKLSNRERLARESGNAEVLERGEHVPFRDSKLTRLLSVHLGGNSQTGVLVTMTPAEEFVEQSLQTLRFAQKASTIRCVAKPVVVSKEQSLILKQREIIAQLHQQVQELRNVHKDQPLGAQPPGVPGGVSGNSGSVDASHRDAMVAELTAEKEQRVEELQALMVARKQADAVVCALHQNNDTLRKQKATMVENIKGLHRSVLGVVDELGGLTSRLAASPLPAGSGDAAIDELFPLPRPPARPPTAGSAAWEPAIAKLRTHIRELLRTVSQRIAKEQDDGELASKVAASWRQESASQTDALQKRLQDAENEARALRQALGTVSKTSETVTKLREENEKLRASLASANTVKAADNDISNVSGGVTVADDAMKTAQTLRDENARLRSSIRVLTAEVDRLKVSSGKQSPGGSRRSPVDSSQNRLSGAVGLSLSPQIPQRGGVVDASNKTWCSLSPGLAPRAAGASIPTVETGLGGAADLEVKSMNSSAASSKQSPGSRHSSRKCSPSMSGSASCGEFEPIVERGGSAGSPSDSRLSKFSNSTSAFTPATSSTPEGVPRPLASSSGRSPLPPPFRVSDRPIPDVAPRLAMDYFRQLGVRTSWKPGDLAYWRGQGCRVVKAMPEDQPLCIVLRMPDGSEFTTDLCLVSDAPPSERSAAVLPHAGAAAEGTRPLRLAPLGDLCLERPAALDRPPALPSPRSRSNSSAGGAPQRVPSPQLRPLSRSRANSITDLGRDGRSSRGASPPVGASRKSRSHGQPLPGAGF